MRAYFRAILQAPIQVLNPSLSPEEVEQIVDSQLDALEEAHCEIRFNLAEPESDDDYLFVAIELHNSAQTMAMRAPNGVWHWEALPLSGPDHKKYGSWDDLLDHYGRTLPLQIHRLVREGEQA